MFILRNYTVVIIFLFTEVYIFYGLFTKTRDKIKML